MSAIGILAGGGRLPLLVADTVIARGGRVHIVALEGDADPQVARFPHTWVNIGAFGRMLAALRTAGAHELVIAGGIRRPDLRRVRPDWGLVRRIGTVAGMLAGGDNAVLSQVVRVFEQEGFSVRGAHEVAPDLLAPAGRIGAVPLPEPARADADLAFALMAALAPLDAGQAAVVAGGQVLAIEGAEGTDAMLQRVAEVVPAAGVPRGVLVKGPKRGQDLRVDMPAVGPRTIDGVAAAGLAGLVLEAGGVLMLDREEAVRAADARGITIAGVAPGPRALAGVPGPRSARLVGRHRPRPRERADLQKGLEAALCLAPFR
ncbi:MAG TPA: UDP-2,3-diacylglucosamine diphosphatase LpxI, partial [Hyphomicrobiaceae bacterium]|nr:UDP-2,3-diacylglucosamine diphosphatase LpxI [Hyphomicrobiaceae bacterium]